MLTIDTATLPPGEATQTWVLEIDMEYGQVQQFGQGEVYYDPARRVAGGELESGAAGGCYREPQVLGEMQLWSAEEHYLAIFPDEASMREGGHRIAEAFGDHLPAGIHRVIARSGS